MNRCRDREGAIPSIRIHQPEKGYRFSIDSVLLADFPVRGVGDHEVERPGGKRGNVFPEIAQDGGETAPETVLLDVPTGELPQRGLDLDPHALP